MSRIEVGKEYDVVHERKGKFRVKVDAINGTGFTGTITKGTAHYLAEPDRGPGDSIELDTGLSFVSLTPAGE